MKRDVNEPSGPKETLITKSSTEIGLARRFSHALPQLKAPGWAVLCLCFLIAAGASAQQPGPEGIVDNKKPTFTTIDAVGAGNGAYQGTYARSVEAGFVTGGYVDAGNVNHGFVCTAPCSTITTIDIPGAGAGASQGTSPVSVNSTGATTGWFTDASSVYHGFVCAAS